MATVTETRPAVIPTAGPLWDPNTLPFGTRLRLLDTPGVFRVVREAAMGNDGHFRVRIRQLAENGSLVGPVRSVRPRDVAAIVTDAIVPEVAAPAPVVVEAPAAVAVETADEPRPLVVACVISIDHVHYNVSPLAPAPGATKAYRLEKVGGDEAVYDLDETATGASCDCPDFVFRHEGLDALGCKHIRAARHLGLIAEAPEHDDARAAYDTAREKLARLEAAERVVRAEGEAPDHARDIVLVDDDGTPLETAREMDARHRAEHAAEVAALMEGNPFLPACCPDDEVLPCRACVTHGGPDDLSDDSWDDSHVWAPCDFAPDPDDDNRPFASWLDEQAEAFAAIGSPRAKWLAGRIAKLAEQARWLDAASPDAFDDRLDCMLDAAADAAEARMASRCC